MNTELPKLIVSNISKQFPDGTKALENVSFTINQGEFAVIGGSNGSGKSVLMSIIAGLEAETSGEIQVFETADNNSSTEFSAKQKNKFKSQIPSLSVGLIFQDADAQIMGETPEEDISFGPRNMSLSKTEIHERTDKAIKEICLEHKRLAPARFLSGGEKRRLSVAGILAMNCNFFIFDEPFANLDWPGVEQVCNIMKNLKEKGNTVIVLTHELEKILGLADKFIVLNKGVISFNGTPEDGLKEPLKNWGIRNPIRSYESYKDLFWGSK